MARSTTLRAISGTENWVSASDLDLLSRRSGEMEAKRVMKVAMGKGEEEMIWKMLERVGQMEDGAVARTERKRHTLAIPISFIAALAPCVSTFLAAESTSNRA